MTSQNIELSSWDTLYKNIICNRTETSNQHKQQRDLIKHKLQEHILVLAEAKKR
jgi:hypothetical protein